LQDASFCGKQWQDLRVVQELRNLVLDLLVELRIECQVGDPVKIRAAKPRNQKQESTLADSEVAGG
jgi:hypothetical protein